MTTNQYTFNGDGQRVQIVDSEGTKKPIWDFENILLETDGSNVSQVIYTLEPNVYGNIVSQRRGSTTSFYLFDALGSTRKLTNSAGSISDSYDFKAYGETFVSSGSTKNVFRWVGELGYFFDIDRLAYYLRARPYNPGIARFLSRDPIGYEGSSWNLFEYANGLVTMRIDPRGLAPVDCQQEWRDCNSRAFDRNEACFVRGGIACTILCAARCKGQVTKSACWIACVGAYWSACDYDLLNGQDCCLEAKKECDRTGEWPEGIRWWKGCP
jgi:RHS repeat-associated protein